MKGGERRVKAVILFHQKLLDSPQLFSGLFRGERNIVVTLVSTWPGDICYVIVIVLTRFSHKSAKRGKCDH